METREERIKENQIIKRVNAIQQRIMVPLEQPK